MTPVPVVVPVNNVRNCIVQDGIRYCENKDVSPNEFGVALLFTVGILLWVMLWFWIGSKLESKFDVSFPAVLFIGGFIIPMAILGIILIT